MLIETATNDPSGNLQKEQFSLEDIRRHVAGTGGRSVLTLKTGSQFAFGGTVQTWEAFATLSARLATLSDSHPVALMDSTDWDAAVAAHGG